MSLHLYIYGISRDALGGNVFEDKIKCSGRTIIVTGANCGMGEATADNFAQRGYISSNPFINGH